MALTEVKRSDGRVAGGMVPQPEIAHGGMTRFRRGFGGIQAGPGLWRLRGYGLRAQNIRRGVGSVICAVGEAPHQETRRGVEPDSPEFRPFALCDFGHRICLEGIEEGGIDNHALTGAQSSSGTPVFNFTVVVMQGRPPAIVTEYMSGGSLRSALSRRMELVQGGLTRLLIALDAAKARK